MRYLIIPSLCVALGAQAPDWESVSAFRKAAFLGDLKAMQALLDQGVPIDSPLGPFGTSLEHAARVGRLESVQFLVERGASLKREGRSVVLMAAIRFGRVPIVTWLIQNGHASAERLEGEQIGPLQLAMDAGQVEVTRQLLILGADVNALDAGGETALSRAVGKRNAPFVQMLLEEGKADPNAGRGALSALARGIGWTSEDEVLLDLLLRHGADLNPGGKYETPLGVAARWGSLELIQRLLGAGARIHGADSGGRTTLHAAMAAPGMDRIQRIKILLEAGADPFQRDRQGISPLRLAFQKRDLEAYRLFRAAAPKAPIEGAWLVEAVNPYGHSSLVEFFTELAEAGVDLRGARNTEGQSLLHKAMDHENEAFLRFLLDTVRVEVDVADAWGGTALLDACHQGHLARVQLLHGRSARLEARTRWGANALHLALEGYEPTELVDWLLARAPGLLAQADAGGRYPVHVAVEHAQDTALLTQLAKAGADLRVRDKDGRSLVHVAAFHHKVDTLRALVEVHRLPTGEVDAWGRTPLLEAANARGEGAEACTLFLMAAGGLDQVDKAGNSLLHLAAGSGQTKVVRALLEKKNLEADRPNGEGWTPLLMGAEHSGIAQLLLERGARATICSSDGETPLLRAAALAAEGTLRRLLSIPEVRRDLESRGPKGATPLLRLLDRRWSKQGHSRECLDLLLEAGADPRARNDEGQDAFALVKAWSDPDLTARLEAMR